MKSKHVDTATLLATYGEKLLGEDRHFGGDTFSIEMIPATSHQFNLRLMMPVLQWKKLRLYVIERCGARCEFCEGQYNLEAHERWDFDESAKRQTLKRLMCLCKSCHLGVHIGLAGQLGYYDITKQHVLNVTGWTTDEFKQHVDKARDRYKRLSKLKWKIDTSMVQSAGIALFDNKTVRERVKHKREQIDRYEAKYHAGSLDLRREVHAGYKAFCYSTLEQKIRDQLRQHGEADCILIDDDEFYGTGGNSLTDDCEQTMDLAQFNLAFNNPVIVDDENHFWSELQQSQGPKRIVLSRNLASTIILTSEMVEAAFQREILFSRDV